MKHSVLILVALAFCAVSCNNAGQKRDSRDAGNTVAETGIVVFDADTLYAVAESFIDEPVAVRGYVTHTCKHSGKKCFLTGEGQKHSIRVEAKGDISGFNQELVGSRLEVNGILRERRLTQAEIAEMESNVNEQLGKEEISEEACETELANIREMREWMEARGKDYYSIYYIDGLRYDEIHN